MKYFIGSILVLCTFVFTKCSKDLPTSPKNIDNAKGGISLKIDKTTAPKNVVRVIAYLTRTNYDTLSGELNLLTSTSADISFEEVPVGTRHLKVNALNSDTIIVYTGDTEVQVNAGINPQVNLTLIPTGLGTGSIDIVVNWGNNTSTWTDFNGNPIYTRNDSPTLPNGVGWPIVLESQDKFKMWYINIYNSAKTNVWYAESNDGFSWQSVGNAPVLTAGNPGTWDDFKVAPGAIIIENGQYKMYYIGMQDQYGAWQIGLAVSNDGINWEKYPDPVLDSTANEIELYVHSVLNINGKYYMYYDVSMPNMGICLAFSEDGVHWTRYSGNPILTATQSWENGGISYPSVIYDNNEFKMIYDTKSNANFGYATSPDGINWTKDSTNPVFSAQNTNNNWANKISYPYFNKFGDQYRLYYVGSYFSDEIKIGVAFKM